MDIRILGLEGDKGYGKERILIGSEKGRGYDIGIDFQW